MKFTDNQQRVIDEIQRVAQMLGVDRLSQSEFDEHHTLASVSTAGYQFGSWNRAVKAAGLEPYDTGPPIQSQKFSDEELLKEILHLEQLLGKQPSEREMARFGKFSPGPYKDRWGSWVTARDRAHELYGDSISPESA